MQEYLTLSCFLRIRIDQKQLIQLYGEIEQTTSPLEVDLADMHRNQKTTMKEQGMA